MLRIGKLNNNSFTIKIEDNDDKYCCQIDKKYIDENNITKDISVIHAMISSFLKKKKEIVKIVREKDIETKNGLSAKLDLTFTNEFNEKYQCNLYILKVDKIPDNVKIEFLELDVLNLQKQLDDINELFSSLSLLIKY
jgi:hypothetical protein